MKTSWQSKFTCGPLFREKKTKHRLVESPVQPMFIKGWRDVEEPRIPGSHAGTGATSEQRWVRGAACL